MCSMVQAMLAKTISSICHKGHFVVKGLLSPYYPPMITIPHGPIRELSAFYCQYCQNSGALKLQGTFFILDPRYLFVLP